MFLHTRIKLLSHSVSIALAVVIFVLGRSSYVIQLLITHFDRIHISQNDRRRQLQLWECGRDDRLNIPH